MLVKSLTKKYRGYMEFASLSVLLMLSACNGDVAELDSVCEGAPLTFEQGTATCFAFLTEGNGIGVYQINQGKFTPHPGNIFGLTGPNNPYAYSFAIHPSQRFLYVGLGRSHMVSAHRIDADTGAVDYASIDQMQPNTNTVNIEYRKVVVHSSGSLLFAFEVDGDDVEAFTIDNNPGSASYGEISRGSRVSPFSSAAFSDDPFAMEQGGTFLYYAGVQNYGGGVPSDYRLFAFTIDPSASGSKLVNEQLVNTDQSTAFTAVETSGSGSGHLVWVTTASTLQSFRFTGTTATPTWQDFSSNQGLNNPKVIRVANGKFVYVGDDTGIHGFAIADPGQALALSTLSTPTNMGPVTKMYIDPAGAFLYTNGAGNVFRIDPDSGSLTIVPDTGFPGIMNDGDMKIMPRQF